MCIKDFKFNNVIYFSDSNKIHQEENANIDLQITNENKSLEEIVKDIAINYNFIVINVGFFLQVLIRSAGFVCKRG